MNPFTKFLSETLNDRKFRRFIEDWDVLECLVIDTFRNREVSEKNAKEWQDVCTRLRRDYPNWEKELQPCWATSLIDGQPTREDPFKYLLSFESIGEFRQNWRAMQTLPAAREAINKLIIKKKT